MSQPHTTILAPKAEMLAYCKTTTVRNDLELPIKMRRQNIRPEMTENYLFLHFAVARPDWAPTNFY